jgi:hypothetical protein
MNLPGNFSLSVGKCVTFWEWQWGSLRHRNDLHGQATLQTIELIVGAPPEANSLV